ncbi:Arc family DNA-binding protein [Methylobacterium organophilum]|uniref:Arc family DNA-binding protein n=1 Tax=Methylobacterium organophilum TaxID=410 RepID=UPI001F138FDF|nr:Arc family DNA-binding protein [Methylobacterium organophilum]UMY16682.1 Arc family DNA-binding protein [Methylobacterium organophilum]
MAAEATGRASDKFMLRLPDGMRDQLKVSAEENKRSMNAEIVARLEESLSGNAAMRALATRKESALRALIDAVEEIYEEAILVMFCYISPEQSEKMLNNLKPDESRKSRSLAVYQLLRDAYERYRG